MGLWMCPKCSATNKDYPETCKECGWDAEKILNEKQKVLVKELLELEIWLYTGDSLDNYKRQEEIKMELGLDV